MNFNAASPLRFNSPEEYFNYELDKQVKKAISEYEYKLDQARDINASNEKKIRDLEDKLTSLGNIKDYKFKLDDPISPQVTGINHRGQLVTRGLGLTKREYFIGQALTGLLANKELGTHGIAEEAIFNGTKVAELLANED
jgi:hypothetical protein